MVGEIVRVAGPVVVARGLPAVRMHDVVHVGELELIGEVIRLEGPDVTIQVYEDTSGLRVGEPVVDTAAPLMAELGPGLLGSIFDGLQRPLPDIMDRSGPFIERGVVVPALPRDRRWSFTPQVATGQTVRVGDVLGVVSETSTLEHRVLVPPGVSGTVTEIQAGDFGVETPVAWVETKGGTEQEVALLRRWPVRQPRPVVRKLDPETPLITGQRVIDTFFPVAKGGAAIIPGGFGTGKTVLEQTLAKWADADVIVYVGCGERGNEMTEVLADFPELEDPRTGASLMDRTVLIANTSNMPVAAREASIYIGITIAEYYRDMGYSAALLADSTSRWGEALREVSGRLEEMPAEEGYPAYLGTRLADFYERAGRAIVQGSEERESSVTVVSAVSPPGGDFSEPMTQSSLRVAGIFWALDTGLARRRHFPAINWRTSFSLHDLDDWFDGAVSGDWSTLTAEARSLLQKEEELQEIVQLVGADALPESERAVLAVARRMREDFLQQSAFDRVESFCPPEKTYLMLRALLTYRRSLEATLARGVPLEQALSVPETEGLSRMKRWPAEIAQSTIPQLVCEIEEALQGLTVENRQ